eukprot:6492130-Amphidinium_carterae.2
MDDLWRCWCRTLCAAAAGRLRLDNIIQAIQMKSGNHNIKLAQSCPPCGGVTQASLAGEPGAPTLFYRSASGNMCTQADI